MTFVYGVHARQITNGPSWMETECYNVTGKPDGEGQPSIDQWKEMLKKLLAERFKLTFRPTCSLRFSSRPACASNRPGRLRTSS